MPLALGLSVACSAASPAAERPEISAVAPLRLPASFVPSAYRARLAIDPARTTFEGTIAIAAALRQPTGSLSLHGRHLTVQRAHAVRDGGADSPVPLTVASRGEDVLELRAGSALAPGAWTLELDYTGELDERETSGAFKQSVAGAAYVFTQFEAVYARRVFPCVDEPDRKVPWQLTLDVPAGVTAVSNTPLRSTTPLPDGGVRFEFEPSQPLPTYLVAFGVGPFDIAPGPGTRSGTPVRMITLAGRARDAAYSVATTAALVDRLEEWFGIPYPYEKLDLLTIPLTLGFVAMENAGLITFSEELSLFEQNTPSWEKRHTWILVAAHELAHQWFGNYVTMAWWDDIWLNEGFATWMETKIASRFEPDWHDELAERDTLQRALEADRVVSARRIREPIRTADDIFNVFDAITYDKGASILNMFESYVGAEPFRRGVRQYLEARAFGNATSNDFVTAIGKAVGRDLSSAFASFLDQPGAPELVVELDCAISPPRLGLSQRPFVVAGSRPRPSGARWTFPVCSVYDRDGERAEACTLLEGESAALPLPASRCPRWVMPNAGGRGYYRHTYGAQALAALRDAAWPLLTGSERRAVFFDVRQAMPRAQIRQTAGRSAGLPPRMARAEGLALALSLVDDMLAGGNRFTVHDAVAFATDLDRFIPDALRPQYEGWLRRTFAPDALRLGLWPRSDDDLDAEVARERLVDAAGWFGRDPTIVQQAVELGPRWHDLPQAVRGTILKLAVDADSALAAAIERGVEHEPDRARRGEMIAALGAQRNRERLSSALRLLMNPGFDFREALGLLSDPSTAEARALMRSFFRAHEAELMRRLPHDDTSSGIARLARLFTDTCEASERARIAGYSAELLASLPGGKITVQQSLEAMDQCIATRALLAPQIRAWLAEL